MLPFAAKMRLLQAELELQKPALLSRPLKREKIKKAINNAALTNKFSNTKK